MTGDAGMMSMISEMGVRAALSRPTRSARSSNNNISDKEKDMTPKSPVGRRTFLTAAWCGLLTIALPARASAPRIAVTKDPDCACCGGWVDHLKKDGFDVSVIQSPDLSAVKRRLGVPAALAACHTAEIGDYAIEGHVPASAIRRLLAERPIAKGLAVPGMPVGSPGMEGGVSEVYDVVIFGEFGQRRFATYRGSDHHLAR